MTLGCLIVDDEPLAHRVLRRYIDLVPELVWLGSCTNAPDAMTFLRNNPVDLVFLDIQMPQISGMDLLRTMPVTPIVIITSAHAEHALESYEFSVADYLLKPIAFERFLKAVNKVLPLCDKPVVSQQSAPAKPDFLFVKADKTEHRLRFDQIVRVQGCGNFVEIHTIKCMYLVNQTMAAVAQSLPSDRFVRTHKSHIVNLGFVIRIEGQTIILQSATIPIGRTYKKTVSIALAKFRIPRP